MHLRSCPRLLTVGLGFLCLTAPAMAATPAEVDLAVQKAIDFLNKAQNKDGNWETVPKPVPAGGAADVTGKQWGGLTAITTYALLAAGEDPVKDLARPIKFLKDADIDGIYATGLRCQVWLLDSDEKKKLGTQIDRDKETLLHAIHIDPKGQGLETGFYGYFIDKNKPAGGYDRSVSQYGVLGMWALEQAGAEVPQSYWKLTDAAWKRAQNPDGGWNYNSGGGKPTPSTTTMTAAGIATLFITQDYTSGNLSECRGNIENANIEKGLGWMDKNIKQALGGNFYGMYGIERIGVASGRKYFDVVDWYQSGADRIVKSQGAAGNWGGIPDTCFALLFLVRGRAPVVMNKLEYSVAERNGKVIEGPWNERPRDCANFAHWMAGDIEHFLNWQIVNLKVGAENLHDAPILYLAGNHELVLSNQDIETLRTFVEQGGMILGNADCGNQIFAKSFEKLGTKLFPKYEFREIPHSHVIFTNEQFNPISAKWKTKPKLLGLSNGVRELMLLVPEADLSRAFQARNEKTKLELYQMGANIFLYAVDKKNLETKGNTYIVKENAAIKPTRKMSVARLEVGNNSDPEPGGWLRMAALLHNVDKVEMTVSSTKCDAAALKGFKIAHLTGTTTFKFGAEQAAALKSFVETGGTLIVDAAGGNAEFADAADAQLQTVFGKAPEVLPLTSQVYTLPDSPITSVKYRIFSRRSLTGDMKTPRVKAIDIKGRLAVFISKEDLTGGIVGEQVDGIIGYDPASATAIMRNLLMFGAFGFPKPPATQPTTKPATRPTTPPATLPAGPQAVAPPAAAPAPAAPEPAPPK